MKSSKKIAAKFVLSIIISTINSNHDLKTEFEFREYRYAMIHLNFFEKISKQSKYLNTKAKLTIINRDFFFQFKKSIRKIAIDIIIQNINANKHKINEYAITLIFFRKIDKNEKKYELVSKKNSFNKRFENKRVN